MTFDVHQLDEFVLVGAVVTLAAILAVRLSARAGLPSLLIYLFIGVLLGEGGPFGIPFDDAQLAHALGIDLEETDRDRPGVASRVLRPEELAAVEALPPERRWRDTAIRFSIKEAIYKALHPYLLRYIGFGEVAVWPSPDGIDRVEPFLGPGENLFAFDARHYWVESRVFSTVRVRPRSDG